MKKRVVYIMMFLVALLLGGCNLFSGLDKEDLDAPGAFEFKLDDAMSNGDYTVAIGLIDSKIASDYASINSEIGIKFTSISSLSTTTAAVTTTQVIDMLKELTKVLDDNISPEVKEYINLKVIQAEAYLGESGLKMTDIVAKIPQKSTNLKNLKSISKATSSSNSDVKIAELVPAGLKTSELQEAINSYLKSLPSATGPAFEAIKNDQDLAYLNAALSSAISAINRFIIVFKDDANSTSDKVAVVTSTVAFGNDDILDGDRKTNWESALPRILTELQVAIMYINLYEKATSDSLIDDDDIAKLNDDFSDLIGKLVNFTKQDYVDFTSQAGF